MSKEVIIIGGGNAGLAAAIGLKQRGFVVKLYEKTNKFESLGGDIGLWPCGLKILDKLGVYRQVYQQSGHYQTVRIGTENGECIAEFPAAAEHSPYSAMNICRYKLQDILFNALEPEDIIFGKKCIEIKETADAVFAHFSDGTVAKGDFIIGADGMNSLIRNYVTPQGQLDYTGYIGLGGINTEPYQIKFNLLFGKYLCGAYPLGSQQQMLFFVTHYPDCDLTQTFPSLTDQFNLFRNHSPLIDEMLDKLETSIRHNSDQNYFFVKSYNLQPLSNWSRGRVVLIGEAAHCTGPILGCATSIIFEGVDILVNSLAEYKDNHTSAFNQYQLLQQPRVKQLAQFEREFVRIHKTSNIQKYLELTQVIDFFLAAQ
jgi:FAD-dependent urate hydroxylase